MDRFDLNAPLGHHVGGHRRIDTAGEQAHRSAANTRGQTAGTGFSRTVDVSSQVTDFHIDGIIRMMDIHFHSGVGLCQTTADLLGQGDGCHGERLIGTLGFHLEGLGAVQFVTEVSFHSLKNGIHILLTGTAAAQGYNTENTAAGFPGAVHVTHFVHRLHIDGGLHDINIKIAVGLHPAADILAQTAFKLAFIGAFEHHFAQLHQKDLFHLGLLFSKKFCILYHEEYKFPSIFLMKPEKSIFHLLFGPKDTIMVERETEDPIC